MRNDMGTIETFAEKNFRSEEVERELIAYICKRKPALAARVESGWFSSTMHSNMMRVVKSLQAVISRDAMLVELRKRKLVEKGELALYQEAVDEIYKVNVSKMNDKSATVNMNTVIEMYEGRSIAYGIRDIVENIKNMTVEDMKNKMRELGSGVKLREEISGGNYTGGLEARVKVILEKQKAESEGRVIGIPTGIRAFDTMTGGLMKPEFGVIAGQPGVGKSATLGAFALNAWRGGRNVMIVTGEMPKIDMEFRMDSDLAGIQASKFRFGNLTKKEMDQWRSTITQEHAQHSNFLEVVSFPRNFTAADIESYANQVQDQYEQEIDLICIDYINIMNAVGSRLSSKDWQSQADVIWDLKSLCADLNGGTSAWTAGQVKDEAIDSDLLSLEDLKYARAISETAPVVVGLVRSQDDDAEQVIELQILKMRNAPVPDKSIILRPNLEYMRIHEEVVPVTKDLALQDIGIRDKPVPRKRERNGRGRD
jgi:replicative DNA helicase